jgi:ComF family protein
VFEHGSLLSFVYKTVKKDLCMDAINRIRACFPSYCCLCDSRGQDGLDLCGICRDTLPDNVCACVQCGLPLPRVAGIKRRLCGRCQISRPVVTEVHAPFLYRYPMPYFVTSLKFQGEQKYARLLGDLLAQTRLSVASETWPEALVPVPLHRTRLVARGFNQSALIAHYCGQRLGLPVLNHVVRRTVNTQAQTGLSRLQRLQNIRGAFAVTSRRLPAHVAIVDDVLTTGSTLRELARCLRRAGVSRVDAWVCARAS